MEARPGNDPLDTMLGLATNVVGLAILWFLACLAGTAVGEVGVALEASFGFGPSGSTPADFYAMLEAGKLFEAFTKLPETWIMRAFASALTPIGIVYLPLMVVGGCIFLTQDERRKPLLYSILILGSWPSLFTADLVSFPFLAFIVCVLWSGIWIAAPWMEAAHGRKLQRDEDDYLAATGGRFSMLALAAPAFPEIRVKEPELDTRPLPFPPPALLTAPPAPVEIDMSAGTAAPSTLPLQDENLRRAFPNLS